MPIDKRVFTQDIEKKGLKVFVGSEYNIRVAESTNSTEAVDFTQKGNVRLIFPTSASIKKDIEVIETKRLGVATALKYLGKTQITGDQGDVMTPNGAAWYNDMTLGGTFKAEENNQALISIEADGEFLFTYTADTNVILENMNKQDTIDITATTTVKEFIDKVNAIKDDSGNQKYLAVLHIGEGTEILKFEDTSINGRVREFFRCGDLSEGYKKTIAPYINYIIPRRGDPRYFNILESSNRAPMSTQFYGCRFLSLNTQYQNSNLTNITANIWGGYAKDFTGTPTQAEVDDLNNVYAQTNHMTSTYCSKQRATAVASLTNTFTWEVEPQWNITNEPYEIPVSSYTDSYDFEIMFNEQSKSIFQDKVNNGENISIMIDTSVMKDNKEYKFIKSSKTLLGQPQYPAVADGIISLSASGFTSVANTADPYTSMVIVTSDKKFNITYTEQQIKNDFNGYIK